MHRLVVALFPPAPPLPPVASAVFDGSLFGIRWPLSAVAGGAAPPGVTPFAPVTLTLPACADMAPADNKPKGSAVSSSGRREELRRSNLITAVSRFITI
jgi:hypothetical protein